MKIFRINVLLVVLFTSLLFERCVSDTINLDDISDSANREYSLDAPGMTVKGSVMDIVDELDLDTIIEADENGLLRFYYSLDYDYDWKSVIGFDELSNNYSFQISSGMSPYIGGISVENAENIVMLDDEDVRLDTLRLTDTDLNLDFDFSTGLIDSVIISIPQLYSDNGVYADTLTNDELYKTYTLDLSDYYFVFSKNASVKNSIDVETKVVVAEDVVSSSAQYMNVTYAVTDINLKKAIGNFGNKELVNEEQTLSFDAFDVNYLGTSLSLKEMSIIMRSESTIGIPISGELNDMYLSDTETGVDKAVDIDDNQFSLNGYEGGGSEIPADSIEISIVDLMDDDFMPNQISSMMKINVDLTNEDEIGFITDTSTIVTKVKMYIPFWFKTSTYSRQDTIDFDYNGEIDDSEEGDTPLSDKITELAINFDIENGLPFDIKLQVYMLDGDYNKVDSIFESEDDIAHIGSAEVDSDGKVTESTTSSFSIEVESDDLDKWGESDVKYLVLKMAGVTGDDEYVQVTEDEYINATLSFSIKGKFDE